MYGKIWFKLLLCVISRDLMDTNRVADDGFAFYKISFQWYSTIGLIMTWIPAVIISHLTGGQDLSKFNIQLLSPFVQNMLPIKYRHIELKTVIQKRDGVAKFSKMDCDE